MFEVLLHTVQVKGSIVFESVVSKINAWPEYTLWTLGCLAGMLVCLFVVGKRFNQQDDAQQIERKKGRNEDKDITSNSVKTGVKMPDSQRIAFKRFQYDYLSVYLMVMFADWLQGTNMYTLYQSYGVDIGGLFLVGFLTSAVCGTFIGPIIDTYGRKKACILFCILEIIINTLEHSPNFTVLVIGRLLGGITTSLLFSAFESWMVTEHHRQNFPDDLLSETFSIASIGNGLVAVAAGLCSQVMADHFGHIGPFQLSVASTIIALGFVCFRWSENYGAATPQTENSWRFALNSFISHVCKDKRIALLGVGNSLFEGSMYIFVFLWVPTMQKLQHHDGPLPTGLIFSCFMVCIAIGGECFSIVRKHMAAETAAVIVCLLSTTTLFIPLISSDFYIVLFGFLLFEICVGAFFPCSATLRSRYFPEAFMGTIMNAFRFPLNILVVIGTSLEAIYSYGQMFAIISVWMLIATLVFSFLNVRNIDITTNFKKLQ